MHIESVVFYDTHSDTYATFAPTHLNRLFAQAYTTQWLALGPN